MFRKSIALILAICSCVALAACQRQEEAPVVDEQPQTTYETVYDFEKTIRPVSMNLSFGAVTLNDNTSFVSEGKQSVKLSPSGTIEDFLFVYFPFESGILGMDYTNFNYITEVKFDVFASDDMVLKAGFYFSATANLRAQAQSFNLTKGMNTIILPVEHSVIALQYPLEKCYGMYVQFETSASENNQSVWVDNIQVLKTTEAAEIESNIILDEWDGYCELADFEHAYQQIIAFPYTNYNRAQLPDIKVVKASDYGLTAPSGEKILRFETYPDITAYGDGTGWTQVRFSDAWFDALDIGRFDPTQYELKFDMYQEGEYYTLLELNLYTSGGSMDWGGQISKPGEWVTYSAPLSNFTNWMHDPGSFVLAWADWDPARGDSCVFYLDNIRVERISD